MISDPQAALRARAEHLIERACKFNCDAESSCQCYAHELYRLALAALVGERPPAQDELEVGCVVTKIRPECAVEANASTAKALQRADRYGVGTIEQALAGYKALPADTAADWRSVLGLPKSGAISLDDVDREYKRLAKMKHPDSGGSEQDMSHLNRARDYAVQELTN